MRKICVFLLGLGLPLMAFAQTLTIREAVSRKPVELATLISRHPQAYAVTNAQGQASVADFTGAARIEIRCLGYKTVTLSYADMEKARFELLIEISNLRLDEVVVSATRWRQLSDDVPAKIVAMAANEVILQNPQTAADLLGSSGSVFIQKSQQGGGSPMIRGFATNRLLYTVDGVRMNTAIFRAGNIQNVINLDPFATESTEVLFGPGSVTYGSDAIGGVMSFQTLTPRLSLDDQPLITGKAVTRYSTANNEKSAHFDVNVGWSQWALVTSISSWHFDHLRQGSHGPDDYLKPFHVERINGMDQVITQDDPLLQVPTAYSQLNLMQKVRFTPNAKWDFQYGFHYSGTTSYGRYDRHCRLKSGLPRYAEWNYGPQTWMMNNLNITHSGSNAVYDQMTLRLAWQSFGESRVDRSFNKDERNTQSEAVEAYSANIDFSKAIGSRNTLAYGLEYVFNNVTSTGLLTDISAGTSDRGPSRYPQATWSSLAAFLNDQHRLSDSLTLQAGLRCNYYTLDALFDTTFYPFPFTTAHNANSALTGSLGAVWRPAPSWVVSANVGTAFRSPNVDDLGKVFDSEPGAVTVPNPGLEAEYAWNADLGVAKVFGDAVKLDVTAFCTILQNAMVRRDFQLNGLDSILYDGEMSQVQAIQNAAVAHVYGIQAGLEVQLPAGFSFSSDLNWQVGREELDDGTISPSRHAAPLYGISRLSYKYNKLNLQLYGCYQGEKTFEQLPEEEKAKSEIYAKDESGNNYSPAWYTLNLKAMYRISDLFTVSAGMENITDRRYRPYSSGISGAGRNFFLSLRADF